MGSGGDGEDPFAGLELDETFVRAARRREPSAAERAAQADRSASGTPTGAGAPTPGFRVGRRSRPPGRVRAWTKASPLRVPVLVAALAVAAALAVHWSGADEAHWTSAQLPALAVGAPRPTPSPAISDEPLGTPGGGTGVSDAYAFIATQDGSDDPVAYDPCRPISVVVNPRSAPPGADGLLADSLDLLSGLTGLQFEVEGTTDEVPSARRESFQPDRYGDRWAPVLVAWTDPVELPELEGRVAGIGGSQWAPAEPGAHRTYVSGIVALDGPQLAEAAAAGAPEQARGVVLHELAHLVGLDHVDDPGQLMHAEGQPGIETFQDGDRAGLARLGTGTCVARL